MSEYISEAQRAFDYATYKQPADKIRQNLSKIYNNPASSAKRWVWELVQNAKDIRNKFGKVSIVIELESENKLVFRHNGDPFKINNIIGLIRQVSSKDSLNEDEETTGKFGTGFICTHILSEIIDINGVLNYQGYRKFDLRLDRSGRGSEELIPRIREVETKFKAPEEHFPETPNYEGNRKEEDFDTSFTYYLASTEKQKAAKNGLDDLINTLPITLVTQSKNIKQVRVIDRVNHSDVVYSCESSKLDSDVKLSIVSINDVKKYYLTYETTEVALTTEVECKDGGYVILKRDNKQPVLYRDFPLIGSETFYFPYTLNGFRMNPTEKRNSIPLNGNDNWEAVENRKIIDHAVESALKFNDWLIAHNATNRYLMAYSQKPVAEVAYDEDVALPWIKDLQKSWREKLLKQNLLECEDGYYPMEEMLLPDCSKKESREKFWDLMCPFVERRMPKKEHIHEWREIMVEYPAWNCDIKYTLENFLDDLAGKESLSAIIEKFDGNETAAIEWLNKVIKFTFAELGSDAFDNYAILPNQNGIFATSSELCRDNTNPIPVEIKEAYQIAFDQDIKDKLLHSSIEVTYITTIQEYNLTNITSDLNAFIKDGSKTYDNRRDASYCLTQLYSNEKTIEHRSAMNSLCSCFTDKVSTFSKIDNVSDEIWAESDRFILTQIPYWIEKSNNCTSLAEIGSKFLDQVETTEDTKVIDWLNQYLKLCINIQCTAQLSYYAIFPNQNGRLKTLSDLRRDNANPIPTEIKDVYQITFGQDIKNTLLHSSIDVTLVSAIKEYNLTGLIGDLNNFIKDANKTWANRRDASYALTQLYSNDSSKDHRSTMYYLLSSHTTKVSSFSKVDNLPDEIWAESDRLLLYYLPYWIADSCTTLTKITHDYLNLPEEEDDTKAIEWINTYLRVCSEIQYTSHITKYAFFPSQSGELKKIGELSFDNNIPEEIKDLSEIAQTKIDWRSVLLDSRIEGYELNSPKTTSDVYHSISDAFDKSVQQLTIAKHAIALNCKDNTDVLYMYDALCDVFDDIPEPKTLANADGFDWEKFIACAIVGIAGEVATKINISTLATDLSSDSLTCDNTNVIEWVDKFINFVFNYRGGRYKSKITELDNHGIWINQSGDFCMLSDLYRDGGIAEELKDLAANNPVVNFNYRDILLHNDSIMSSAIDKNKTINQIAVLTKIDESLEKYNADKQSPDFRALIFGIMELDKQLHISDNMRFYKENKEKLIVGSLGEGDTMKMVAGIIQQGDEKIQAIKEILEGNSLEDLQTVKSMLKGCPADKLNIVKDFVDKIANGETPNIGGDTPTGGDDKVVPVLVPETYDIEVVNFEGKLQHVRTEHVQYAGLSLEEIENYVAEAKAAVVKYFREMNERENLGLQFDNEKIVAHSYSQLYGISDKDGNEIPLVVHSYKGPQFRYFDLNWYDWQLLSRPGSMLWVLTVSGLQCIPLYALPVRNFNFSIDSGMNIENRAALLTLAQVGKQYDQYDQISFDFGNNMPHGFVKPLSFNYVPNELKESISSIKEVCDSKLSLLADVYNTARNIPIVHSITGYSRALKEMDPEQTQREIFESTPNDMLPPSVGTSFID